MCVLVGSEHAVAHGLALLVDQAGEQLLRVSQQQSPGDRDS